MKKIIIPGLIGFLTVSFSSCSKTDLVGDSKESVISSAARKAPQGSTVIYGGQATGLNATITTILNGTVNSNQYLVSHTGLLPASGGSFLASEVSSNVQGVITTGLLNSSVTGADNQTQATSSVSGFNLSVNGLVISADQVNSTATAVCGSSSGSSLVTNLVINGQPVTVTGAPNQVIFFPTGGYVMINGQSVSKGKNKNITVTGLRIVIPNSVDVNVATARAEIKC